MSLFSIFFKTSSLKKKLILFFIYIFFALIPGLILSPHILKEYNPDLRSLTWDNSVGTVLNTTITDNGKTKLVQRGCTQDTIHLYDSTLYYSYNDKGKTFYKTYQNIPQREAKVKNFQRKYYQGKKLKLKINPENRSEVIIRPDDNSDIIFFFAMAFITSIGIYVTLMIFATFFIFALHCKNNKKVPIEEQQKILNNFFQQNQGFESKGLNDTTLAKFEILKDTISPRAPLKEVEWTSISSSFSSGVNYKISKTNSKLTIKKESPLALVIFTIFLAIGIFCFFDKQEGFWFSQIFGIMWCLLTFLFMYLFSFATQKRNFDKIKGVYYEGRIKKSQDYFEATNITPLSQIKSLQILHCENPYVNTSYHELNLVLRDNNRVNILNETDFKKAYKLANEIANFLCIEILLDPKIDKNELLFIKSLENLK